MKNETYWDTPEILKLFVLPDVSTIDARLSILNRIDELSEAINSANGCIDIVDGLDMEGEMSRHEMFSIQMKALCVSTALSYALNHMSSVAWKDCCEASTTI